MIILNCFNGVDGERGENNKGKKARNSRPLSFPGSLRSYMMEFGLPYLVKLQGSLRSSMLDLDFQSSVKLQLVIPCSST
ncbi:hypothetical protein RDI58_024647 [Solanum bulbocastanum]|uniref:Uncharacterized protein n=1 Tax=Solanum bulbocastanum TaxID=147425 RepID=A0AAN8SYM5_SOLBU